MMDARSADATLGDVTQDLERDGIGADAGVKDGDGHVARVADAIADTVPTTDAGGLDAAPSQSRPIVLVGLLFSICSLGSRAVDDLPGLDLPARALDENFNVAWTGFDVILLVSLSLTAITGIRRSTWMVTSAGASAALLVADAWFDVSTSGGIARWSTWHGGARRLTAGGAVPMGVQALPRDHPPRDGPRRTHGKGAVPEWVLDKSPPRLRASGPWLRPWAAPGGADLARARTCSWRTGRGPATRAEVAAVRRPGRWSG